MERLQKIIAHAGVTSRRKAEELILAGRVSVNGAAVSELGAKADPARDRISIDGKPIGRAEKPLYVLLNKPRGVVSTLSDPEGRPTIADFLRHARLRLYPVGRLDFHTEGLLLLTNDGELAYRIMHASSALPKTYWTKVSGRPDEAQLQKLRDGIYLDGRRTAPAKIRWLDAAAAPPRSSRRPSAINPWLEVILIEGRQNQIRRMFASIGHPVEKLKRVRIGPLEIGNLKPGEMRQLTSTEVARLRHAASAKTEQPTRTVVADRGDRGRDLPEDSEHPAAPHLHRRSPTHVRAPRARSRAAD